MNSKILWQLQLSNYTKEGKFVLSADSNWQIFITKALELIKIDENIKIDVLLPELEDCLESPIKALYDLGISLKNVHPIFIPIQANALATRYDFPWKIILEKIKSEIDLYTHVYINDPLLLPHYKALFYINTKNKPKWVLQTHFLDSPMARVVDDEISYWHGTIEACTKADVFLWHCKTMQNIFKEALLKEHNNNFVESLMKKSDVWKDGYSIAEIRKSVDMNNVRFNLTDKCGTKTIIWVPNRVGGLGKSFDYTNNGKFLFEIVPELWKKRQDFVVLAGNPNQKISNDEIEKNCPAYVKLVDGPLNRDEYRYLSQCADIVVGLYTNDTNGGLASLEAIEFGAVPFFPDIFEYKVYFDEVNWPAELRINPTLENAHITLDNLLNSMYSDEINNKMDFMMSFIRKYSSYESTTQEMFNKLGF